jgi:hypothetical protein
MKAIFVSTIALLLACCASPAQVADHTIQIPNAGGSLGGVLFPIMAFQPPYQPAYDPADLKPGFFLVSSAAFHANVRKATGESDAMTGFKELAWKAGVDLSPPKSVVMIEGAGMLEVNATARDLDKIKAIVDGLHCPPQHVHIKARFIEISQRILAELQQRYLQQGMTTGVARLTSPQASVFLNGLLGQKDVKELAEPEVVTISGGQTRMYATPIQPIVQNFAPQNPALDPEVVRVESAGGYFYAGHNSNHPQAGQVETGPGAIGSMLNVVPLTPPDGYTISLCVTAYDAQSFDYARTAGLKSITAPSVQRNQASAQQAIYDGQTLVLFPASRQQVQNKDKVLVALVTATLIDEAGDRIHTDDEMSFAQNKVPPPWP